jgi:oxygen-dependent protoporphyrinogen oxidase
MRSVAIIGGGITGLTAAFRLREAGVPVTVYEGSNRTGGVIQSVRRDGFLAESGPNTILETSPKIPNLVEDLNLVSRRMHSDPAAETRYLVRYGRPIPLSATPLGFLGTPMFSIGAKLRLLREPFIKAAPADEEESVEKFVLRRLGREFLDYAINPMIGGIYAGDPAKISVKHGFPKLYALEQKYHSLIKGQIKGARERKRRPEVSKQNAAKFSFDEGLQVLTDELRSKLGESVRPNTKVTEVRRAADGWQVVGNDFAEEHAAVLYAGTAHGLARLKFPGAPALNLDALQQINYPPVASVVLGFRRQDVGHPCQGFGMLIPQVEGFNILGTIFSSALFPNRAPAGHVLLTSYLGGARNPVLAQNDEAKLIELTLGDLRRLLGVTGKPVFSHTFVFPEAIPQYNVGYGKYKDLMADAEQKCPGIFLAGQFRNGISLGDCIVAGHDVAARIQSHLSARTAEPMAAATTRA